MINNIIKYIWNIPLWNPIKKSAISIEVKTQTKHKYKLPNRKGPIIAKDIMGVKFGGCGIILDKDNDKISIK